MKFIFASASHIGNVRTVNQDNFFAAGHLREPESQVDFHSSEITADIPWTAAVFDGLGGEINGDMASLLAAGMLQEDILSNMKSGKGACVCDIGDLILRINKSICSFIDSSRSTMGSTCVFLEYDGGKVRSWNVGDSRAYIYRSNRLVQISHDHTEAESFRRIFGRDDPDVEKDALTRENVLTQKLGIPENEFLIEPYVSNRIRIGSGDKLLLCSDGLTHRVKDDEIASILGSGRTAIERRNSLVKLALDRGGQDNITVVLIEAE